MLLSKFVSSVKRKTYQNATPIFYEDTDIISDINNWLNYIYNYINSKINWFYAIRIEEKNPSSEQNIFNTDYEINNIYEVRNKENKFIYVKLLKEENEERFTRNQFTIKSPKEIKTYENEEYLKIKYLRWPTYYTVDDTTIEIDLPNSLLGVLDFFVIGRMNMQESEIGKNKAINDLLDNYLTNIWHLSSMDGFIPDNKRNNG